jgi:transposase
MDVSTLLADPTAIHLDTFVSGENSITLRVHSIQEQSVCPSCNSQSGSLHSNYIRRVADLPWHNVAVKLELHVRKFRCRNELCSQKVFCERLPKVAGKYARKTVRLETVLTYLAFAPGGEARTAGRLQIITSGDTLLRLIRRRMTQSAIEPPKTELPRVIGVDDCAWRKGCIYGTIIVDLERRKVIDLLPDREAETLAEWLRKHQTVETVARDRSPTYRCGIVEGNPMPCKSPTAGIC